MIAEFDAKEAAMSAEISEFESAIGRLKLASSIGGQYGGPTFSRDPQFYEKELRRNLRVSGWKLLFDRLQIDRIASANDKALFERTLAAAPDLTIESIRATFGDYILRPRFHILRGLAECFIGLDPAYKSHTKVKIGVSGLPKRIIVSNVGRYGSYGREKIINVLNALSAFRGSPLVEKAEMDELDALYGIYGHKAGEIKFDGHEIKRFVFADANYEPWSPPARGVTIRKFQNGNAHIIFDKNALLDINRALAEFYGDVLPDAEDDEAPKRAGTAVAKDLQFYPTPKAVIEALCHEVGLEDRATTSRETKPLRVLEPSCGDGRILDEIRRRGHRSLGIEVDAGRSAQARTKGHAVVSANFLEQPATADFDMVLMNPPFYGTHWRKHLDHAKKFLRPGGVLACILPASAWVDHGPLDGSWHDLPTASFAESGTNIATGILTWRRPV